MTQCRPDDVIAVRREFSSATPSPDSRGSAARRPVDTRRIAFARIQDQDLTYSHGSDPGNDYVRRLSRLANRRAVDQAIDVASVSDGLHDRGRDGGVVQAHVRRDVADCPPIAEGRMPPLAGGQFRELIGQRNPLRIDRPPGPVNVHFAASIVGSIEVLPTSAAINVENASLGSNDGFG